jgi:IS1 family transposase
MNKLSREDRARILHQLCGGSSIRAVTRLTGASKNTVSKLLVDAGHACAAYQDRVLRNLTCKRVQVDEIWSFARVKHTNMAKAKVASADASDVWTWIGLDADTKLIPSFIVGDRSFGAAKEFIGDLAERFANRIQLASDRHRAYLVAVEEAFGADIDYARLVKIYGQETARTPDRRYSPPVSIGAEKYTVMGNPDPEHASMSYVERQNPTIRMSMRRFTRLTNGFSKKIENHACAVAVHSMFHNFVRTHQTIKMTPAMAAGVTDRPWEMMNLIEMIETFESREKSRSN